MAKKINKDELNKVNGGGNLANDNAFYRYVMSVEYKCNDCDYVWQHSHSEAPTCCPECGSTNIKKN